MKKRLPKLKNDQEAEKFINTDLSDYIHAGNFSAASFEFAPKNQSISLRLSDALLNAIRKASKKMGIPYQRYIRQTLEESLKRSGTRV